MSTEDRPAPDTSPEGSEPGSGSDVTPAEHEQKDASAAGPGGGADPLRGSRAGAVWVALVGVGVLLVLLVIFILQNTQSVRVSFLGFDGRAPLAVCLLIAAAAGILLTALAGTLRILQLRHRVRRATRHARR